MDRKLGRLFIQEHYSVPAIYVKEKSNKGRSPAYLDCKMPHQYEGRVKMSHNLLL